MIIKDGVWFKDELGRRTMARGINLGGSSKVPSTPDGATYRREGFFEHRTVSFVGRPFPLAEADGHFRRLRRYGFNFLRFLITWEAIEHAGPGQYDEAYLDYLRAVVIRAGQHGFDLFIDPHQDVWSRFTGGDGAPGWTLEALGFDMTHFLDTGAAIVHAAHGDPLPRMIWPTNGSKLAAATMFSLFFGGSDFAPETRVEGEPVQEYLQQHYCEAIRQAALRLNDLPNVVGYDTMNEPLAGYIGWRNLQKPGGTLLLGDSPSPYQSMLLGEGIPQQVGVWKIGTLSLRRRGTRLVNQERKRAWREGSGCIWRQNGVWDMDVNGKPVLLRPDHFWRVNGRQVDFSQDYYRTFANRFAETVRSAHPGALIFLETAPGHTAPRWGEKDAAGVVYAPHWYDGFTLLTKIFSPLVAVDSHKRKVVFGRSAIQRSFARQLAVLKEEDRDRMGGTPLVLGEFGIPFDLNNKKAYQSGDFRQQVQALERSYRAVEANLLNSTLWNYTADNTNERGDLWNDEDLSIFSRDQQKNANDPYSGGRALQAVIRPYARATAGEPLEMSFDCRRRQFVFRFRHDPQVQAATEIFVPEYQYSKGCRVEVSDGTFELRLEEQTLLFHHSAEREEHTLRILPVLTAPEAGNFFDLGASWW
jgi:hypothetical protein